MSWDDLAAGIDCPFDVPRKEPNEYWDTVAKLSISTLCLSGNQTYRGACILIFDPRHAISPDQLAPDEWAMFAADAHRASRAIRAVCKPDHLNLEILGSSVPHLHWHIVPRYKSDPRWGGPIWTTTRDEFPDVRLPATERVSLMREIGAALSA